VADQGWDFFDRVIALTSEVGPGSAEEFPARFPRVLPKGMQVLTGLDYDLMGDDRWVEVTFTMASAEQLTAASGVAVSPEQHLLMSEEVCLALAFASLQLLRPDEFHSVTARVVLSGADASANPLAAVSFDRPDMATVPADGQTLFEALHGVSYSAAAPEPVSMTPAGTSLAEMHPREFELLVKDLLEAMGLTAKETPYSKDDGVDIIAEDHRPFHRGRVVVQVKRYSGSVGVTTVRELNGVLPLHRAQRGIVVTTGTFTREAVATAGQLGIELVDGVELQRALAEHLPG
jgi:hypothetical protein